jgi:hypothetical protein
MPAAQQAAEGYDHLTESYAAAPALDPAELRDTKFANGLEIVLDGLALRLRSGEGVEGLGQAG